VTDGDFIRTPKFDAPFFPFPERVRGLSAGSRRRPSTVPGLISLLLEGDGDIRVRGQPDLPFSTAAMRPLSRQWKDPVPSFAAVPVAERSEASESGQQSNSSRSSRWTRNLPLISWRRCSARHI
jgi:hypothetical protein